MNDWFNVVEDGRYRRNALLAEARMNRRMAALQDGGIRAETATLLIKVAQWLAPASTPHHAAAADERVLPRIARI